MFDLRGLNGGDVLPLQLLDNLQEIVRHKFKHGHEAARAWCTSGAQIHEEVRQIGHGDAHVGFGARCPHLLQGDPIAACYRRVFCAPRTAFALVVGGSVVESCADSLIESCCADDSVYLMEVSVGVEDASLGDIANTSTHKRDVILD